MMHTQANGAFSRSASTVLWITYINVALYALCFQLQRPIEPYLVRTLTESGDSAVPLAFLLGNDASAAYGRLQSFFSLVQTIGSPLVGILLDRIGVRSTSVLVFASSAASYAILAHATDLRLLFLSKIPAAMQHAFLVAQAAAATATAKRVEEEDEDDDASRAQALGRMTTAYTVGATFGPALGGYLAQGKSNGEDGDLYAGAHLAVWGSVLSAVMSWLFLPDAHYHTPSDPRRHMKRARSFVEDVRSSAALAARAVLWPLLAVKVIGGVSDSMHSTALPLALTQQLRVEPSQLGVMMSASMFAVAAFGAVGIRPLTAALGTNILARCGLCARAAMECIVASVVSAAAVAVSSLGASQEGDTSAAATTAAVLPWIVAASVVRSLASHALATSLTTMTTGAVLPSERGALLGLEHGLFSVARVIGPTAGTTLLALGVGNKGNGVGTGGSFWSVAVACTVVDVCLATSLMVYSMTFRDSRRERDHRKGC